MGLIGLFSDTFSDTNWFKTTDFYNPEEERSIRWDDQDISIDWPIGSVIKISSKDEAGTLLKDADLPD